MRDIDRYTQEYIKHDFEEKQVFYRRKKLLEIIHTYQHKRILEIGCGQEPLFQFVTDFEEYTVVEPSDLFFEHAVSLAKNDSRITCIHDFFDKKLSLSAGAYDFIICSSLLHELDNPNEIIEKVYEIADDETVFHINVPNARSLHRILALESGLIESVSEVSERGKLLQQARVFDLDKLRQVVAGSGFKVMESGSYFVKPFTHKQMEELLEYNIIDDRVLEGLYNLIKWMPDYGSEIYVNACKK
ncbi:MAG: class I SAM-dependent methyltransferase [Lachnospiraceae bacterium]|nr:class I SAM-dependent methyltransferase [Lachnospiraceae bacterium]